MARKFKSATKSPRKPRASLRMLTAFAQQTANDVNTAFGEVAQEIDQLRTVIAAIADVQGIREQVVAKIKEMQNPPASAYVSPDDPRLGTVAENSPSADA